MKPDEKTSRNQIVAGTFSDVFLAVADQEEGGWP